MSLAPELIFLGLVILLPWSAYQIFAFHRAVLLYELEYGSDDAFAEAKP